MKSIMSLGMRRYLLAVLVLLVAVTGYFSIRRTHAGGDTHTGADNVTRSNPPDLPYYDVRLDKSEAAQATLSAIRLRQSETADARGQIPAGEAALRARVPSLKLEYSPDLQQPEVIGTDITSGGFLTAPRRVSSSFELRLAMCLARPASCLAVGFRCICNATV